MSDRDPIQAALLDRFVQDSSAPPPVGLDPAIAATATLLATELTPPHPSARFVHALDQRLSAEPPPASNPQDALLPLGDDEIRVTSTASGWQVIETTHRSRFFEAGRLIAAVLAIMLIGSALIFMFSEKDPDDNLAGSGPLPSDQSRQIVVSWDSYGGQDYKLFIVHSDTGELRKLTPGPAEVDGISERFASWSPDGQRIAFVRLASGTAHLMLSHPAGGEPINLSEETGIHDVGAYSWSPDSSQLAVRGRNRAGTYGIHLINANDAGTQPLVLDEDGMTNHAPAWSPDGRQIAFIRSEGRSPETVYVVGVDGSGPNAITRGIGAVTLNWSPDGSMIAITAGRIKRSAMLIDADGSNQVSLSGSESTVLSPVHWSPDGNLLAFAVSNPDLQNDLVTDGTIVVRLDGLWRPLTEIPGLPAWSPDGTRIAVLAASDDPHQRTLYLMNADGSNLHAFLENRSLADDPPAWQPVIHDDAPAPAATPTPVVEPTKTPLILTEPPRALLTYEDQTQSSGAHSYCWPDPSSGEDAVVCEHPTREPPAPPALHVPRGASLGFTLEGVDQFTIRGANGVALVPFADAPDTGMTFESPGTVIPFEQGPDGAVMVADVPDGDYSFEIEISMDVFPSQQGDASYAFRVVVGGPEAPDPDEATAVPPSEGSIPTTLSYEDQTQTGVFAYGCNWQGDPVCVDPAGLLYPSEPLVAMEGGNFIFSSKGLDDEPRNHQAYAYPINSANVEATDRQMFLHYPVTAEIRLPTFGTPEAMQVIADMPPGDYVVAMVLTGSDNSGTYGFHVRITEVSGLTVEPHTTGTIIAIEKWDSGWQIHTAETPDIPDSGGQYYVFVSPYVRVFERTQTGYNRISYDVLEPGMRVSVAFVGEVAESDPAYANATEIVILERPVD